MEEKNEGHTKEDKRKRRKLKRKYGALNLERKHTIRMK